MGDNQSTQPQERRLRVFAATHLARGLYVAIGLSLASPAIADPALVSLGIGGTDILNQQLKTAGDLRLEYRSGLSLLPFFESYFKIKPWAGIEVTSRHSLYGAAGILIEVPLGPHFVLTPNIGIGPYNYGGGKNLGSVFEIRSTFEGGYVFDNGMRLVASIGHTSNAGITRRNPGTEQGMISFQIPISAMVGGR